MLTLTALIVSLFLQATNALPADRYLSADLKKQVTSRRSKPGEEVKLALREEFRAPDGSVLLPAGARLVGKVVLARKRSGGEPAALSIVLERAEWDGGGMPLNAVLHRLDVVASVHHDACLPSEVRAGGPGCYRGGPELTPPPPDCTVAAVGENLAITCAKREVELAPDSILLFRTVSPKP